MTARIIDGKAIAQRLRADVAGEVARFRAEHGRAPCLATVLVGEDPASQVYIRLKQRACEEVGILSMHTDLPTDTTQQVLTDTLSRLAADDRVDAILTQLPLPDHLDEDEAISLIPLVKDVDCFHPQNVGALALGRPGLRPCTPAGVMHLLDQTDVDLSGAEVVVVGRSNIVGKPLSQLLLHRNATVTICHSRTRELAGHTRQADIVVMAVGRPGLLTGDMVREGAVVIDVGVNRTDEGLVGDVDFDSVADRASWITPVPGGVGPMTIAMLLSNTVAAARMRAGR